MVSLLEQYSDDRHRGQNRSYRCRSRACFFFEFASRHFDEFQSFSRFFNIRTLFYNGQRHRGHRFSNAISDECFICEDAPLLLTALE
jgi:hypothetical protein